MTPLIEESHVDCIRHLNCFQKGCWLPDLAFLVGSILQSLYEIVHLDRRSHIWDVDEDRLECRGICGD